MAWKECVICGAGFDARAHNTKVCSRECKSISLSEYRSRYFKRKGCNNVSCIECGVLFKQATPNSRVCSNECKRKRKNRARVIDSKICVQCGSHFDPNGKSRKTCSIECGNKRRDHIKQKHKKSIKAINYRKYHYAKKPDSSVKSELKRQLGTEPPSDLVEEATALRLLNRVLRENT